MKTRKFVGGFFAVVGLMLAVCTADDSTYEMLLRGAGAALFAIGAYVAKVFDFQDEKR